MPWRIWFVFDLGNVVVRLAYERVIARLCASCDLGRDELIRMLEKPGGYRDLERGALSFREFYEFLRDRAGYREGYMALEELWADFFDGPMEGIEELLDRVRREYRVAFLSNSNEIHAEVIPREFAALFEKEDRFIFSHRLQCAKPDPAIYQHALEILGALPSQVVYTDDLAENVEAAIACGITAFKFTTAHELTETLEREGILQVR